MLRLLRRGRCCDLGRASERPWTVAVERRRRAGLALAWAPPWADPARRVCGWYRFLNLFSDACPAFPPSRYAMLLDPWFPPRLVKPNTLTN